MSYQHVLRLLNPKYIITKSLLK